MKHIILLFACVYLAFSVNLSAQNVAGSVEIGVYSAYEFGTTEDKYKDSYKNSGYSVGLVSEYHFNSSIAILGSISYEVLKLYREESILDDYPYTLPDGSILFTPMMYTHKLDVPQLAVSVLGKASILNTNISILTGFKLGILSAGNENELMSLASNRDKRVSFPPLDSIPDVFPSRQAVRYSDDSRTTLIIYDGEIYQRKSLQLGLTAGLQYDLPIYTLDEATQKFVTLTPSVLFNYNLTTYSDYEKLRAWNVSARFVLKVGL